MDRDMAGGMAHIFPSNYRNVHLLSSYVYNCHFDPAITLQYIFCVDTSVDLYEIAQATVLPTAI